MNNEEKDLRIMELEDAFEQAQHTISFLHNCLVNPDKYKYNYPAQTLDNLVKMAELYKPLPGCFHSIRDPECEVCKKTTERQKKIKELKDKLK